jgi:5'-methylthioadenosine phosphorylase
LQTAEIGIIGGSGLYAMPGLTGVREHRVETPFGEPSDAFIVESWRGARWHFWRGMGAGTGCCRAS